MTPRELQDVIRNYWIYSFRMNPLPLFSEVKVRVGDVSKDTFLHHLEVDCGVEIELNDEGAGAHINSYTIIDEEKYIIFLLRWQ